MKLQPIVDKLRGFFVPKESTTHGVKHSTYPWQSVLWLTGVDYFSTLGYQPGIAFLAAGALSPIATAILVLVTLAGALPVYEQVAKRSYAGQGSIAMLEGLIPGWIGKLFVLTLLGFAATDYVITMTLSAADAAEHVVSNPLLGKFVGHHPLAVTCGLLALLTAVFLRGFTEAIGVAVAVGVPYLILNAVVVVRGFVELWTSPGHIAAWTTQLSMRGDPVLLIVAAGLVFPKLALGMSGFETGVSVMPLVHGDEVQVGDGEGAPLKRIHGARRMLLSAAVIMSVMLLASSLVTTTLIPEAAFQSGGEASGRALSYLAHLMLGHTFGTIYDVSTIAILWFAGASAMAGMLSLIPRYLPRFGMAPEWVKHSRPLVVILFLVDILVTWRFDANVEAQGAAYATGVLVLMLSASVAVALSLWREAADSGWKTRMKAVYFWGVSGVLLFTLVDNVIGRPEGVFIASLFVLAMLVVSAFSRYRRATELRIEEVSFVDEESRLMWHSMKGKQVNLVPTRTLNKKKRAAKVTQLRQHYRAHGPIVFVHIALSDDRSEFTTANLRASIRDEGDVFIMTLRGAVAVANTIAWVSEQLDPIALYLELSQRNPFTQALQYLIFGEGETGILVYQILLRYWASTPEDDVRPLIFLVSSATDL